MIENKSTLQVITERIKQESLPRQRDDPYKVGLVIEGGAMRASIGAGMAVALQALQVHRAIDAIYSVSAGCCTAAYLVSEQAAWGTSIYYQDLQRDFISLRRFLGKNPTPVIDVPFLTHNVMMNKKRLNWEKVIASPIPIHMYSTSAEDVGMVDISLYLNRDSIHDNMHFSCRVPIAAGLPIKVDNKFLTDGNTITGGIPLDQAIADKCTHILALLTRPEGNRKVKFTPVDLIICHRLKRFGFNNLAEACWNEANHYNQLLNRIDRSKQDPNSNPQIEVIQLPGTRKKIGNIETRAEVLRAGAVDGFNTTLAKFKRFNLEIDPTISII